MAAVFACIYILLHLSELQERQSGHPGVLDCVCLIENRLSTTLNQLRNCNFGPAPQNVPAVHM